MKITNLKPEMSTLEKVDDLNYNLDYGTIQKGSDPHLRLKLDTEETEEVELRVGVSCGGCTTVVLNNKTLNIKYNTNLLGRITKKVYIYKKNETIKIALKGKII